MKKLLLSSLLSVLFLASASLSAEARIVVGATPQSALAASAKLDEILTKQAGDDVQLRSFDDYAALSNWLLRFQELDAAIVSQSFIKQQPAGSLRRIADLHKSDKSLLTVVVRSNLGNNKASAIQKALLALDSTSAGQKALASAGIFGFSLPGETLKRKIEAPRPKAKKTTQKATTAAKVDEKKPPQTPTKQAVVAEKKETVEPSPAPQPEKAAVKAPVKKVQPETTETVKTEQATSEPAVEKPLKEATQTVARPSTPVQKAEERKPAVAPQQGVPEQAAKPEAKKKSFSEKRFILFVALVILVAILLKLTLLVLRWQSKKRVTRRPAPSPVIEPTPWENTNVIETPHVAEPVDEPQVVETGFIGPGKVPALLKRCADLREPVVLQVTKDSCEKLIYFAGGKVSGAMTQNANNDDSDVRWNKLGSMLLREEFITVEERDQALALLTREPKLRFGEALLQLGYISLAELRHALTRQAKITIYSLILFPEGAYKIFAEEGSLPPEESVALEVTSLIREASHHQSEWMAIRQALPNLNTALDFTPEGREKLEQVKLSPQQEEMLSLVDGKRTINELGIESTMMDYEVYRFLYMMVKAGVLQ